MKLAVLLLVALPAFGQKVTMEFDRGSDFPSFKTFFVNEGQLNAKSPLLNNDIIRKRIQDGIRAQLAAKGLMEVTSGRRDLNVRFSLGSVRRQEVDVYPAGWWGVRRIVTPYTEGTLVIDLHETGQRALVWRTVTVEDKAGPAQVEAKLDNMIKKAFEHYPPKKK